MALTREQKQNIIEDLRAKLEQHKAMLFFDHSGIEAKELFALRNQVKKAGSLLKVVKKTLFALALGDKYPALKKKLKEFEGQLSVIFGLKDAITSSKALFQLGGEHPNLKVWGGFFDDEFQGAEKIETLARLPSKQALRAQLVTTLAGPSQGLVNVLRANLLGLVQLLSKVKTAQK